MLVFFLGFWENYEKLDLQRHNAFLRGCIESGMKHLGYKPKGKGRIITVKSKIKFVGTGAHRKAPRHKTMKIIFNHVFWPGQTEGGKMARGFPWSKMF